MKQERDSKVTQVRLEIYLSLFSIKKQWVCKREIIQLSNSVEHVEYKSWELGCQSNSIILNTGMVLVALISKESSQNVIKVLKVPLQHFVHKTLEFINLI